MPDVTIRIDQDTQKRLAALGRTCGLTQKNVLKLASMYLDPNDVRSWHADYRQQQHGDGGEA